MKLVILADDNQKEELLAQGLQDGTAIEWVFNTSSFARHPGADAYIDLLFEPLTKTIDTLASLKGLVIVDAVGTTLRGLPPGLIRINAWPGFLKRNMVEAACTNEENRAKAGKVFSCFNKEMEWTADIPGFISARVVAMIINEAYFAIEEEISSREDIDTAMKTGTNYPYGPFEWAEKIGLKKIADLLNVLAKQQPRYKPASQLENEIIL
jgi:3-hydroxybutyryl-CoA dehydrogenase